MKKLLSFVAVAAIVASTFAFTSKKFTKNYCLSTTSGGTCTFLASQKVVTNGTQYYYDNSITPAVAADCNTATNCVTSIILSNE